MPGGTGGADGGIAGGDEGGSAATAMAIAVAAAQAAIAKMSDVVAGRAVGGCNSSFLVPLLLFTRYGVNNLFAALRVSQETPELPLAARFAGLRTGKACRALQELPFFSFYRALTNPQKTRN